MVVPGPSLLIDSDSMIIIIIIIMCNIIVYSQSTILKQNLITWKPSLTMTRS